MAVGLTQPVLAQTPRENGQHLRDELAKSPPRDALAGKLLLPAYLGLSRVGELRLSTEIVAKGGEKLYHLEDSFTIEAEGFGSITMTLEAYLASDFATRELVLYTCAPGPSGATQRRRLTVAPEGGALWVTEAKDEDKPKKTKLAGVDARALLLTPPFGIGERLARLAPGEVGTRLSLDAWDLAAGASATLGISLEEVAPIDIRGKALEAQKVTRDEGKASLEEWLVPKTREPLKIVRADGPARLSFVGREAETEKQDLPEPAADRKTEGPAATVLRFLRASGRGDVAVVESLLDLDALFEASHPADRSAKFKKTFEKTLVALLTGEEWRRGGSVKLVAGASRAEDLEETIEGDRATVRPKGAGEGAPSFELARTEQGWKIVRLPIRSP